MKTHIIRSAAATSLVLAAVLAVGNAVDAFAKDKKSSKSSVSSKESKAESGYIGVYMQDLTDDVRKGLDLDVAKGVLVSGVQDDSPAEKAGLEEGDVIVSFGGKDVASPDELKDAVKEFQPGAVAKMEVVRDGKTENLTVTVGERPERDTFTFVAPDFDEGMGRMHHAFTAFAGPRLGIEAHEIENDELASYFGAKEGILVLGVEEESVAGKAGVKAGDVIQKIGDEKVTDVGDLRDAVRDFDEGDEFTIGVLRHGKSQSLKATMDEQEYSFFNGEAPMWRQWHHTPRAPRAPRVMVDRESLRDEIDELKKEIQEMKEQLERQDG
ncbi:MAG: PDZ domain-containing protein [Candidatus Latescibacteria bacterium]|nr:PDZ domain-containing protein [Candidatus Latescibacterota bacterium]